MVCWHWVLLAARLSKVIGTTFGRPVEPEVSIRAAGSWGFRAAMEAATAGVAAVSSTFA